MSTKTKFNAICCNHMFHYIRILKVRISCVWGVELLAINEIDTKSEQKEIGN